MCPAGGWAPVDRAEAVDRAAAASIAYVENSWGTGSGVMLDLDHVVTSAHVVRPDRFVQVTFPNSTEVWALVHAASASTIHRSLGHPAHKETPPGS